MARTRVEIIREQFARASGDWAEGARELRELLISLTTEMENLGQRVSDLEAEERKA